MCPAAGFVVAAFLHSFAHATLVFTPEALSLKGAPDSSILFGKFTVVNNGDRSIVIKSVVPSCECVRAGSDKAEFAAGEHGEIDVSVDVNGLVGRSLRSVMVITDEKAESERILPIECSVAPTAILSRPTVHWREGASLQTQEVSIHSAWVQPIRIVRIVPMADNFVSMKLLEAEPGKLYVLHISPRKRSGPFDDRIHVVIASGTGRPKMYTILVHAD